MKLSDTQLIQLSKAAKRDDRAVQLPANIGAAAAEKVVSKLVGAGFIEEIEATGSLPVWRRVEDEAFSLRITDAGLKAIGIDEAASVGRTKRAAQKAPSKSRADTSLKSRQTAKAASSSKSKKPKKARTVQTLARHGDTKHGQILNLLRRKGGASLAEMQKVSGWQPHSVRGFMSGTVKKRLGLKLRSTVSKSGERRYMIAG
jgi:hypothetical protein